MNRQLPTPPQSRRRRRWLWIVGRVVLPIVIIGVANGCGGAQPTQPATNAPTAATIPPPAPTVTKIVDGDTVELSDGRTVRLLGIDTPERGACGFDQATQFASTALLNKEVVATPDPTQDETDRYNRSLLYLEVAGQDHSVAAAAAGWAKHYIYGTPVQRAAAIQAAEAEARAAGLGIWGSLCVAPAPPAAPAPRPEGQPDLRSDAPDPDPQPALDPEPASVYYKNCAAARAAGAAPVHRGEPGYATHLDRDGDGVGCDR